MKGKGGRSRQGHNTEALAEGLQKRAGLRNLASSVMLLHCFASLEGMVDCLGVSVCDTKALLLS